MKKVLLAAATFLVSASALADVRVVHEPPECVPSACRRGFITAQITSDAPLTMARVYFREAGEAQEYYLDMVLTDKTHWAVFPILEGDTDAVRYRIVATEAGGRDFITPEYEVPAKNSCDVEDLNDEQEKFAENMVLGLVRNDQAPVPVGFRCNGVMMKVMANGDMQPHEECRDRLVRNDDDGCLWWKQPAMVVGGAAAGTAIGILINDDDPPLPTPVSVARP